VDAGVTSVVSGVSRAGRHRFSKEPCDAVTLVEGVGVEGDAHAGPTVQHLSRKRWRPDLPNLRQVHLLAGELHDELVAAGFPVGPGLMGENITTRSVDLLALPTGALLRLGDTAVVEVTGLRNPCVQLDRFAPGLMAAVLDRDADGQLVRRAGVMGVVREGGIVRPGCPVVVELPPGDPVPLAPV
jgi:MOSC domain-containing protein YiiM